MVEKRTPFQKRAAEQRILDDKKPTKASKPKVHPEDEDEVYRTTKGQVDRDNLLKRKGSSGRS